MKNSDDIFDSLGGSFFKYLIDSTDEKNKSAQTRLLLFGLGILAFVGVEAVKVVFRKNFGSKGLSLTKIILSSIVFGGLAWFSYNYWQNPDEISSDMGSEISFEIATFFYGFLGVFILIRGIIQKAKPNEKVHYNYRGDSGLLGFLVKDGWSQAKVQNFAEPLFVLALGVFLSAVNLVLGVPLMFCAVSVWLHMLMESIFGVSQIRDKLAEKGYNNGKLKSKESSFTEVKN